MKNLKAPILTVSSINVSNMNSPIDFFYILSDFIAYFAIMFIACLHMKIFMTIWIRNLTDVSLYPYPSMIIILQYARLLLLSDHQLYVNKLVNE